MLRLKRETLIKYNPRGDILFEKVTPLWNFCFSDFIYFDQHFSNRLKFIYLDTNCYHGSIKKLYIIYKVYCVGLICIISMYTVWSHFIVSLSLYIYIYMYKLHCFLLVSFVFHYIVYYLHKKNFNLYPFMTM